MSATATALLECDNCGREEIVELANPSTFSPSAPATVEAAVDSEGWSWHGTLSDKLLCDECSEKTEEFDERQRRLPTQRLQGGPDLSKE